MLNSHTAIFGLVNSPASDAAGAEPHPLVPLTLAQSDRFIGNTISFPCSSSCADQKLCWWWQCGQPICFSAAAAPCVVRDFSTLRQGPTDCANRQDIVR